MDEQEAITKWCPMARVYSSDGAYNKEGVCLAHGSTCIASECMMWRWYNSQKATGHCGLGGVMDKDNENYDDRDDLDGYDDRDLEDYDDR